MTRLSGKVAIITGAAKGLGLAAAQLFAAEGGRIVLCDISEPDLAEAVDSIKAAGGDAIAVRLDVTSEDSWNHAVTRTLEAYGSIDILVNNAGIIITKGVLETELDEWNRVLGVDITGVWLGAKHVIPHLKAGGGGSIVNVSSVAGIVGGFAGDGGSAAYSASKGAVRSLTKHIAQWFAGDNIRSNSVHPGPIFTPMFVLNGIPTREAAGEIFRGYVPLPPHVGEPQDIAYALLYLASDESKFVTGEELIVDGGLVSH
ncbi:MULTISPECIES: SDR family NAD(P)-dependent oxidoreductase [Paenarthrobacter]|uniref:Glucose 1-dehydrogenase n=1 Tax=Paenarthrobacter aromaticivorans TaxID=2849150 RepID=A0ABS6I9Y1_9MICC|nr:glucose 1-dehydrogenase [Paenarthrobacter sp. MMS21-TAE1-1]MBU8868526.1 glucose 1-dehydrogenase [Paenarthrobacter sp. MMS21-TAE1-1]